MSSFFLKENTNMGMKVYHKLESVYISWPCMCPYSSAHPWREQITSFGHDSRLSPQPPSSFCVER